PGGASTANVSAVDGGSNTATNSYSEKLNSGSSTSLVFDPNGNMTSDGTNSYAWDCENRLIKVTYPGSGNSSAFAYDGLGRNVLIQEYTSSSLTSTKQFIWAGGNTPRESRDSSSSIISQYFQRGQIDSSSKRFYYLNQIDSVTEVTDNSGAVLGQFGYSPFGQQSQVQGSYVPDFTFAGYYLHVRSGLNITRTRAYNANLGRFINRDRVGESGGINLFAYVDNAPTEGRDPLGTWGDGCQWGSKPWLSWGYTGDGTGSNAGGSGGSGFSVGANATACSLANGGGAIIIAKSPLKGGVYQGVPTNGVDTSPDPGQQCPVPNTPPPCVPDNPDHINWVRLFWSDEKVPSGGGFRA
ncbi:MAG: RHS repeat-associated core domain-containing protein, partial [Ktedonobacteraceae bacterium]